ncbi:hypothetical protein H920_02511 [Fukomys damarensis]|uniref:Uncharacterized protein n=1 Tax=Fukomys damarensis TaxID=885580 RepID=A0A091DYI5_FUKDA|nr:hypothetical protein H920_02511 [Fukomys damarensis]
MAINTEKQMPVSVTAVPSRACRYREAVTDRLLDEIPSETPLCGRAVREAGRRGQRAGAARADWGGRGGACEVADSDQVALDLLCETGERADAAGAAVRDWDWGTLRTPTLGQGLSAALVLTRSAKVKSRSVSEPPSSLCCGEEAVKEVQYTPRYVFHGTVLQIVSSEGL